MEKLLVIGASGLLGNRLIDLGKERFEMLGTYNQNAVKGKNMHRLDARDRGSVFSLIKETGPDCVIDTHAITNLDYCETHMEETWEVNVTSSKNIADACKEVGCKYLFVSTDNVFDGKKPRYVEGDEMNPLNYYAKTKVAMEKELSASDADYVIARTSVLYGRTEYGKIGFVSWLIDKLKKGEQVRIVTDQRNNPTFTDNLSETLFRLYEKGANGIFHTTGGECISRYEFSREIATTFGLDLGLIKPITSEELRQVALRPKNLNMVTEKVERTTGIKPMSVHEGLETFKKQLGL